MNLASLRFESTSLGGPSRMTLLIPPGRGPFPTLYLLHGLGGDHESWVRDYDLARLASGRGILIVLPEGGRGYYVNDRRPGGLGLWEDHIVRDVRGVVERAFYVEPDRSARAVAGLSMGGYGALAMALRHPDIFGAAGVLSGSLYFGHGPHPEGAPFQTALARGLPPDANDVFALACRAVEQNMPRPELFLACGEGDQHLGTHREFRALLDRLGWKHDYGEFPGGHDREFWSARLPALLDFVERCIGRRRE